MTTSRLGSAWAVSKQTWQLIRIVAEVRVQIQKEPLAVLGCDFHRIDDCGSEATLVFANHQIQTLVAALQFTDTFCRAVGRIVVNDQQIGGRKRAAQRVENRDDILGFLIGADSNQDIAIDRLDFSGGIQDW